MRPEDQNPTNPGQPVVVWADGRTPSNLCKATRRDGTPCRRAPIQGATVCRAHGGAAPQVKAKAQQRLLDKVPKMLRMLSAMASDETIPPAVRLSAIRDWLDRAGVDRKIEIDITSSTFAEFVAGVVAHVDEEDVPELPAMYAAIDNVMDAEVVEERAASPSVSDEAIRVRSTNGRR